MEFRGITIVLITTIPLGTIVIREVLIREIVIRENPLAFGGLFSAGRPGRPNGRGGMGQLLARSK